MLSQQILDIGNEIVKSYKCDLDSDVKYCKKYLNSQLVWILSETGTQGTVRLLSCPSKTGVWYCGLDEIAEWPGRMN
jgi:hypothetical protein